jgi:hypothetical protein
MIWQPNMFEFVLNHLVKLVKSGVCLNQVFKESQMKEVANGGLVSTVIIVSTLQIYNQQEVEEQWDLISMLKTEGKLK